MIAVISNVHGNLEALEAVLEQIGDADDIYCGGDIVGYGPNPNECCELIRDRGVKSVKGNHDYTAVTMDDLESCSEIARKAFHWTNKVLTKENKDFLEGLPLQIDENGLTIIHGSPGADFDKLNTYVFAYHYSHEHYDNLLKQVEGGKLVLGHTHVPMVHGVENQVINSGSVGQPRDENWRASYAMIKDIRFRFRYLRNARASFSIVDEEALIHRADYDIRTTVKKILAEDGLPDLLAQILKDGGLRI